MNYSGNSLSMQMDAVTSYGLVFPVSVWMKKITSQVSGESPRAIVVMEAVERTSACFSLDNQVTIHVHIVCYSNRLRLLYII